MNWYLNNLEKSFNGKLISGLTESGEFVTGKVVKIKPDHFRKYVLSIDMGNEKIANVFASNIRKIQAEEKKIDKKTTTGTVNFCGYLYDANLTTEPSNGQVSTVTITKKEPHTGKEVSIITPSTHIFHENK